MLESMDIGVALSRASAIAGPWIVLEMVEFMLPDTLVFGTFSLEAVFGWRGLCGVRGWNDTGCDLFNSLFGVGESGYDLLVAESIGVDIDKICECDDGYTKQCE